jgi:hypothetical protein
MRDWRLDLAVSVCMNVDDVAVQAFARDRKTGQPRRPTIGLIEHAWNSQVRYRYLGERHVIRSFRVCRTNGGACADAAAFVAAIAYLVGDGDGAVVCTETSGADQDYLHARVQWLGRVVDPTARFSAAVLGACTRVASASELVRRGRFALGHGEVA